MNAFFDDLGRLWVAAARRRGTDIDAPTLDPAVAGELLELTRVVAHGQERQFAPLAAFTAGVACERLGLPPDDLVTYLREVRSALEKEPAAG